MPYKLEEDNGGYYVVNEDTGKRKNKTPISKERAVKYMRALYAAESGSMKEISAQVLTAFKRNFDKNTGGGVDRDKLPASDFVDPERRRFPIVKASDVMDAVHSYGRANPKIPFDEFKRRVIAIAKRKGFVSALPKDWGVEEKEVGSHYLTLGGSDIGINWSCTDCHVVFKNDDEVLEHQKKYRPELFTEKGGGPTNKTWTEKDEIEIFAPNQPALMVYKDAAGQDRWVLFSSNAYQDRDREIVSTAALEADVARADKDHNYGPLRWWHVGKPDPIKRSPGPGMDLGTCDFNAMHGRVLIESGTFNNPKVAAAVKEIAPLLQVSIGYFHPRTEPDASGVFHTIQRFERSILPAGRASNPFTAVSVIQKSDNGGSEMISEKIKAFAALLKDDELVQSILAQAEQKEKEAQDLQTAFKGEEPPAEPVVEQPVEVEAAANPETWTEPEIEEEYQPVIGDMTPDAFAGLLAEAIDKAMEPHRKELADMQASMKTKDDSEAALRESLELQAKTIQTLKSQLDELTGSQPRAATKGYRDSQSETTVVKEDSRVKGKQPTVDPDFIKMFTPGQ